MTLSITYAAAGLLAAEPKAPPAGDKQSQPLAAQRLATEAGRDRAEAATLLAAGRSHEQKGRYAEALRCYQRSWRLDPQSSTITGFIIPAAIRLHRCDEALRYALKADDLDGVDPAAIGRLGRHFEESGDWPQATDLYEKVQAGRGKAKETAADILLQMQMGRHFYACYPYDKVPAAKCFTRVIYALAHSDEFALDQKTKAALLPEPAADYQMMGECFLATDRIDAARAAFDKAEQLGPDKAMRQFNLARLCAKANKAAEALAALDAYFSERHRAKIDTPAETKDTLESAVGYLAGPRIEPYETLTAVLEKLGRKDELIGRLEKLRAADANEFSLACFLATQYCEAGKFDKAEALYRELLATPALLEAARLLAEIYVRGKRFDAVLALFDREVEKGGPFLALENEGQTSLGDAETTRMIVEAARTKLKSEPTKLGYGGRLAAALLALNANRYETAGEFFEAALAAAREGEAPAKPKKAPADKLGSAGASPSHAAQASPSRAAQVFLTWGLGLLTGGRPTEAAKVFQRAIDEKAVSDDPPLDKPLFCFYLAGALAMADRCDEALAAVRVAAQRQAARFSGRPAWVLYYAKRHKEAKKAYRELIDKFDADHDSPETRDVLCEARLAMSNLCAVQGDVSQAEEWLEQVLDEFPDHFDAMNDLAYLWADQNKNLERARRMIQKAVDVEPDNAAYRDSLGWALLRLEKYPQALAKLQKAAAGKNPSGTVFDHLGDAYLKMHDRDKAVESWRRAAQAFRQEDQQERVKAVERKRLQIAN